MAKIKTVTERDWQLDMLDSWGVGLAREAIAARDGEAFAEAGYSVHRMVELVEQHVEALSKLGMLPAAVVSAIVGCKVHNGGVALGRLLVLLGMSADRHGLESLRACGGDPGYSDPERVFTLYRGASGKGSQRRVRGVSWTSSLSVACWFAKRFEARLHDPAVYVAQVPVQDVFCYCTKRGEEEFIIRPPRKCKRVALTRDEIAAEAAKYSARLEQQWAEMIGGQAEL